MAAHTTPAESTVDTAQVKLFLAEQRQLSSEKRLPKSELVKVIDLRDDLLLRDVLGDDRLRENSAPLDRVFAWFESLMVSLGEQRTERRPSHTVPRSAHSSPTQCTREFRVFDRLSQVYGSKFRGAVVANCSLGVAASMALLISLTPPYGLQGAVAYFRANFVHLPVAAIVEFLCLLLVALVYIRGKTTGQDDDEDAPPPTMKRHWSGQRWHQRWLEYRLLAERFRYVDLLLPLGLDAARDLSIAPQRDATRMWHQRYFEACTARALPRPQTVREYRDHVLAVMSAQEAYHVRNHHRRGAVARRLHRFAKRAFIIGISICLVDIGIALTSWEPPASFKATMLFWAAFLPIVSAATYAILTHAEYAKVADASGETYESIHRLYAELRLLTVSDDPASFDTLAPMRAVIIEFVTMAITEATGWRAMLRDKNVPLL